MAQLFQQKFGWDIYILWHRHKTGSWRDFQRYTALSAILRTLSFHLREGELLQNFESVWCLLYYNYPGCYLEARSRDMSYSVGTGLQACSCGEMQNDEILYLPIFLHKGRFPHQFSMWYDKKKEAPCLGLSTESWSCHGQWWGRPGQNRCGGEDEEFSSIPLRVKWLFGMECMHNFLKPLQVFVVVLSYCNFSGFLDFLVALSISSAWLFFIVL